jgi:phage-related protein
MYEWIAVIMTAITAATSIIAAIRTTITACIQKRASRKQSVIEVLNDVVIRFLTKLKI